MLYEIWVGRKGGGRIIATPAWRLNWRWWAFIAVSLLINVAILMLHGQHRAAGWSNKAHFSSPSSCVSVCVCVCLCVCKPCGGTILHASWWLVIDGGGDCCFIKRKKNPAASCHQLSLPEPNKSDWITALNTVTLWANQKKKESGGGGEREKRTDFRDTKSRCLVITLLSKSEYALQLVDRNRQI